MSILSDVDIVLPLGHATLINEPEPGLSITRSARELAKIIAAGEVSRVRLLSIGQLANFPAATKATILYCFRPADLHIYQQETVKATHTALLVHEQDKVLGFEDLKTHLRGKVSAFNRAAADWVGTRAGAMPQILPLPYPMNVSGLAKEWVADIVSKTNIPKLVLWLGPHIRKNSIQGLFAALEAVKEYKKRVNIVVMIASSGGFPASKVYSLLENIPLVSNANVEVLSAPTEDQKLKMLSTSSIVFFPSFDEGYNIPVFEALPFLPSIVMSDCDANRDIIPFVRRPQRAYLFARKEQSMVGSNADEIGLRPWSLMSGDYFSMVDAVHAALTEWDVDLQQRTQMIRQGHYLSTNIRNESYNWLNYLGLKQRRKGVGRAYVQAI